jgi:hypothetical protein
MRASESESDMQSCREGITELYGASNEVGSTLVGVDHTCGSLQPRGRGKARDGSEREKVVYGERSNGGFA